MKTFTPKFSALLLTALFSFTITERSFAQPANDNCANATALTVGAPCTAGTNVGATLQAGENAGATGTGCWGTAPSHTVWYTFTTGLAGSYTVSTDNGGTTDSQIKILSGACGAFTSVACDDDSGAGYAFAAVASATLPAGTTYYVQVDVFGGTTAAFCINVTYNPPVTNDCIFTAIDITSQINGISPSTNPFDCSPYTYALAGSVPTNDNVNGNVMACDPGTDKRDIWFSFTVTASTPDVWIDVYQATGTAPDYVAAVYSGTPGGICGGAITGLTLIDCSDGDLAGGALDMGVCTTPLHPRIDVSTLAPGTYYYRVWEYGGGAPPNGIINLCVETADPIGVTSDECPPTATIGLTCGTATNVNVNETHVNLSNAGCLGNACNTNLNEPQLAVGGAGQIHNNCTGPWVTSVGYANNVMNNSAIYAFNVNASGTCQANVTIRFDNIAYGGTNGNVMQVQVMNAPCGNGASAVMAGTTGDPCFEMRPSSGVLPNGTYYIVVDGQDGQLLEYDLNLLINYAGLGCTPTSAPTAPTPVNGSRCGPGTVNLSVTGCGGTVNWYTAPTGGASIASGASYTTPSIATTTTYYASCTVSGCEGPRVAVVATVNNPPSATFNYPGTPYCQNAANPTPTIPSGSSAGTFSAFPALVFVSTSTGQINLAASSPGIYTIFNTIPASAGCPAATYSMSITITAMPNATISYVGSPYCQNEPNPMPTYGPGASAGTFSSSPSSGLFLNASNGQITLASSTAGTYVVTNSIPAAGGCVSVSDTGLVVITAPQSAAFTYVSSPYCQSGTNPSPTYISGGVPGTFSSTSGLSLNSSNGNVNLALSTVGTYTVTNTIAANGGCPATSYDASITITAAPVATISYSAGPYCQNSPNPSPTFSGGGTAGLFTNSTGIVFVSSGTGVVDLGASSVGTHIITNTIAASGGCASASDTALIQIAAVQSSAFTYPSSTVCATAANPSPTITGTAGGVFSASPATLSINSSTGQIDLSSSPLGTYAVTYTVSGACGSATTLNITITNSPSADFSYTGSPYCQSGPNPLPTFSGGGSAGTFTASSTNLIFVSTGTGEIDLANSLPGTYSVTNDIPAMSGCAAASYTSNVTIDAAPSANFSYIASPYCQSGVDPVATLSPGATAGTFTSTAGLIISNSTTGQIDLSASTANTYTVTNTVAATASCPQTIATATITISQPQSGAFSYIPSSYCVNGTNPSATLASGSIAGTFSAPAGLTIINTNTGEIDLFSSTPNTYTVTNTIPANGGCPQADFTSTITITPVQNSGFNYISSTFCQSGTDPSPTITGISGGSFTASPATLVINNSTGVVDLSASPLGTYSITYTSPGPCQSSSSVSFTITNSPSATFSYVSSPYCQNEPNPLPTYGPGASGGIFSASSPNLVFISTSSGQIDLLASTPGTYSVINTIPASGGCAEATFTSNITIVPADNASFNYSSSSYCQSGANPTPTVTGVPGGTFSATPGLVFVSTSTGQINVAATPLGPYTITYTTPASGCQSSSTQVINITNAPSTTFSYSGSPFCQTAADPSPNFSGTSSAGTFSASPSGLVFVSTSTGQIDLSASIANTYTITNFIAASGGCPPSTSTYTVTITSPSTGNFNYAGSPYCQNGTDPLPSFTSGGVAGTFSGTSGLVINSATGLVDLSASSASTYTVTNNIAASGGCPTSSYTNTITISAVENAAFNYSSASYCQSAANPGPSITGVSGGAFTFSPAGLVINASSGVINPSTSSLGTYTITYTTPGTCAGVSTQTVTISANPVAIATGDIVCEGETIQLTGAGGGSYSWSGPSFIDPNQNPTIPNSTLAASGTYTLTVTNGGCTDVTTTTVTVNPLPIADAGLDVTINLGNTVILNATGGGTYNWTPSLGLSCTACASPLASPDETTDYCVTVTSGGCSSQDCMKVFVDFECPVNKELGVPNAFSPNGDEINDFFCLQGWDYCMADFSISIFDRWGEKVYEVNDADDCWDGTYKGKRLDPGVFVYFINARTLTGVFIERKGNISLIR